MADQAQVERMVAEFTDENPYARSAESALASLDHAPDRATAKLVGAAQALATLSLAYEQRLTRLDLLGIARGEL